ncbi:MAG: hypothetical protein ACK4SJ_11255 [Sphingorhabdus sp.]
MPALVNRTFANTFDFSRPIAASYRDATGAVAIAGPDEPRFDHDPDGDRLGLWVTRGDEPLQHDALTVFSGDWEIAGATTVLWEFSLDDGIIRRRAIYSTTVRATIDACLNTLCHHRVIGAVAGFLPNLGPEFEGYVKYRNKVWPLGFPIGDGAGNVIADETGKLFVESA